MGGKVPSSRTPSRDWCEVTALTENRVRDSCGRSEEERAFCVQEMLLSGKDGVLAQRARRAAVVWGLLSLCTVHVCK